MKLNGKREFVNFEFHHIFGNLTCVQFTIIILGSMLWETSIGLFELLGDVMVENRSRRIYNSSSSERGFVPDNGSVGSLIMLRILDSSNPAVFLLNSFTSSSNASQNDLSPS